MGLETATHILDLVETNPVTGDRKTQGDDHLRMIKDVLKRDFPGADRPFRFPKGLAKTAAYGVLSTDQNKIITGDATAAAFDFTLPVLGASDDGWAVRLVKIDATANAVGIVGTMNGVADFDITKQWESVLVIWTGTEWLRFHAPIVSASGVASFVNLNISGRIDMLGTAKLPVWATAGRPSAPAQGDVGVNSDTGLLEFYSGAWRQPSLAFPIAAGFKNLVVHNNVATPNSKIDIDADAVTVETAGGVAYRLLGINLTIDFGTNGADGLDTGGLANNTPYVCLVIYNPTTDTIAGLGCTEARWIAGTFTLPAGYTAYARLSWHKTNGSAQFHRIRQVGRHGQYVISASVTTAYPAIVVGAVNAAMAAQSVVGIVPASASMINVIGDDTSAGTFAVSPNAFTGVTATNPSPIVVSLSGAGSASAWFVLEDTNVYCMTNGNVSVYCIGWEDNI